MGVGSFVFSSGLVSSRKPQTSAFKQIYTAIRASASILALGIVRTVLTKNLEYQVSKWYQRDLTIGTRNRVWGALEFLHHFGFITRFRDDDKIGIEEQIALHVICRDHQCGISMVFGLCQDSVIRLYFEFHRPWIERRSFWSKQRRNILVLWYSPDLVLGILGIDDRISFDIFGWSGCGTINSSDKSACDAIYQITSNRSFRFPSDMFDTLDQCISDLDKTS